MTGTGHQERPDVDGADRVGQLVRLAGRRPMPDADQMARARAAAHEEWRRVVRRRAWRTTLWGVAAAVLAMSAVGALLWRQRVVPAAPVVAVEVGVVEIVKGTVRVTAADGSARAIARGARLRTGDRVETGADGRVAVSLAGKSVRLDHASAATLAADTIALAEGAVYVDTVVADAGAQVALRVTTPLGTVRHVGTQFEVRLGGDELRVSVREGTVIVDRPDASWTSRMGERLLLRLDRPVERQALSPSAADWSWLQDVPRPFLLEGATVPQFLDWASRELGSRWEYRRPALQSRVQRIVLHGSVEDLTPDEALTAVLSTTGLMVVRDRDRLVVSDVR